MLVLKYELNVFKIYLIDSCAYVYCYKRKVTII